VSFKLSVKNKTGKSQKVRDKTYKVVNLISRCASIISMDISMDIHIHGKPAEPRPQSHFAALYARKRIWLQHFWFFGQHCNEWQNESQIRLRSNLVSAGNLRHINIIVVQTGKLIFVGPKFATT